MEERIHMYNNVPEIAEKQGLAEAIVAFEGKQGMKLPASFRLRLREYGEESGLEGMSMYLGKLYNYYVTGFKLVDQGGGEQTGEFRMFANASELKFHFMNMAQIPQDVLKFWLSQIEKWEAV